MSLKTAILLLLGASLFIMSEASARTLLKNGNLNGILVSKGEFWIESKMIMDTLNDTLHHGADLDQREAVVLIQLLSIVLRSLS